MVRSGVGALASQQGHLRTLGWIGVAALDPDYARLHTELSGPIDHGRSSLGLCVVRGRALRVYRIEGVVRGGVETNSFEEAFTEFFSMAEPRLRRGLVAAYGPERGLEAVAEALAYGWEHWERVAPMQNPVGYLYRVGQSRTRPRRLRSLVERPRTDEHWSEPGLGRALAALTEPQRVAVVLVHGFGWTLTEVGELTGVRKTTVQNHLERGLVRLRSHLEARPDGRA